MSDTTTLFVVLDPTGCPVEFLDAGNLRDAAENVARRCGGTVVGDTVPEVWGEAEAVIVGATNPPSVVRSVRAVA